MDSIFDYFNQQLQMSQFIAIAYKNFIDSDPSTPTQTKIDEHIGYLKHKWNRFTSMNDTILLAVNKLGNEDKKLALSHSYFVDQLFSTTRTCYLAAVEQIKSSLYVNEPVVVESNLREEESVVARSSSHINEPIATRDSVITEQPVLTNSLSVQSLSNEIPSTSGYPYSRLPRIKIPTFDGNPAKWLEYRDLFASMVVSTSLNPVEKLQYLKTSLTGTASQLIQNTALTTENFSKTWESLVSFYDNNRLQINTALDSLFNLKPITKESSVELELLYTTVLQIHSTLETLQQPVETWDVIFVQLTVLKLDSESIKAWENTLGNHKVSICKVEKRCKKCGQKHHTTVHIPELSSNTIDPLDEKSESQLSSST
ncbi:uncharacterized protein LOC112458058, partial [Temnothorax curvispinosus]|uniref:Uncharacterized protein LOC112458058 n=1 Tax=Temnothorax curvispinosus TaxID=300111 RepID=A0A6J1Q6D5_9HYME